MLIEIEALDLLFFRDGKPFLRDADMWADSAGLPMPSVIYGALRAAYAVHHGIAPERIDPDTKDLKIIGLYYAQPSKPYLLPAPLDLLVDENKPEKRDTFLCRCQPLPDGVVSNFSLPYVLAFPDATKDEKFAPATGRLLEKTAFNKYLKGYATGLKVDNLNDYIHNEPKIGIVRNPATHSTEEGLLYRVGTQRFDGLKLRVEISGLEDFPSSGLMKLGGEGKAARFQQVDEAVKWAKPNLQGTACCAFPEPVEGNAQQAASESSAAAPSSTSTSSVNEGAVTKNPAISGITCFKLYLATPAIFKQGAYPDLARFGIQAKRVAAALPKPVAVGGFDMQKNQPKPTYQVVPAGAVYYYQSTAAPQTLIEKLHRQSISDVYPKQGFGLSFIACLTKENV